MKRLSERRRVGTNIRLDHDIFSGILNILNAAISLGTTGDQCHASELTCRGRKGNSKFLRQPVFCKSASSRWRLSPLRRCLLRRPKMTGATNLSTPQGERLGWPTCVRGVIWTLDLTIMVPFGHEAQATCVFIYGYLFIYLCHKKIFINYLAIVSLLWTLEILTRVPINSGLFSYHPEQQNQTGAIRDRSGQT